MGLSTGDIRFIENSKRGKFDAIYEVLIRRNVLVDRYDAARITTVVDSHLLDELRLQIAEGFTKTALEKIPEVLKETMSKKWMEEFSKLEKERTEKRAQ